MGAILIAILVFACLGGAVMTGARLRRVLPEHHVTADSRDTIKLAMGLIATMTALLLGLLVGSAKESYDTSRTQVIQMAAKVVFLDRLLSGFGPRAEPTRAQLRAGVEAGVLQLWPAAADGHATRQVNIHAGNALFASIQGLAPQDVTQEALKVHAANLAVDLAQMRTQLEAQSVPSISVPLLVTVVVWLTVIYLAFSLLAPGNTTTIVALAASALSVSGAILLILEMDSPFEGLLQVPSEPVVRAIENIGK
jgi:hypothetical protein